MAAYNLAAMGEALKGGSPNNLNWNNGINAVIGAGGMAAPMGVGLGAGFAKGMGQMLTSGDQANTNHMDFGQRMLYGPGMGERAGSWVGQHLFGDHATPGGPNDQTMNQRWNQPGTPGPNTQFQPNPGSNLSPPPMPPQGSASPYGSAALTGSTPQTAYTPSQGDMSSLLGSLGNYTYPGQGQSAGPQNLFGMGGSGYNVFGANNTQANNIGGNFFGTQGLAIGGPNALPNGGGGGGII